MLNTWNIINQLHFNFLKRYNYSFNAKSFLMPLPVSCLSHTEAITILISITIDLLCQVLKLTYIELYLCPLCVWLLLLNLMFSRFIQCIAFISSIFPFTAKYYSTLWIDINMYITTCLSIFIVNDGKGNGNPLQCLCLENPMNRGAWQAAVHGITKSQTRLKRLSTLLVNIGFSANFWLLWIKLLRILWHKSFCREMILFLFSNS